MSAISAIGRMTAITTGVVMIAMGVAMITDYMPAFSFLLLEDFPMLSTIGYQCGGSNDACS